MNPDTILVAGDIHGDLKHLVYLYEVAAEEQVDAIVQVGDFGYWENEQIGIDFLDAAEEGFLLTGVPMCWIDGNHENLPLLIERYGPAAPGGHCRNKEGFWRIRAGVWYIPRGTRWVWRGRHFMGLGGAYSIDKAHRIKLQRQDGHQRWFPTEQLTDADVERALADDARLDVLFTHDRPREARVPWDRHDILLAVPNQERIQQVVDRLRPRLLIHGHLHLRYQDRLASTGTIVEGLGSSNTEPLESWLKLTLEDTE